MEPIKKTTPLDFFLTLGMIAALYVSVWAILTLLFSVIDFQFPDPLAYYADPYSSGMRFAIASLLIIFPLYLFITWYLDREYLHFPEKKESTVRRWLVYFTLFVAGVGIVVDLIALINTFLGGEITTRFVLKALAALVVAGGVFGYYLTDLRRGAGTRTYLFASGAFVLVSVVLGFLVMGSPATQRSLRFDSMRISHLQQIQWQVANHWQQKQKLPAALSELEDAIQGIVIPKDPETEEPYAYRVTNAAKNEFELCATFDLPSQNLKGRGVYGKGGIVPSEPYYGGGFDDSAYFKHEAGKQCFTRTIDPDRFPPIKPMR
ncbi:MAG: DUF5671 domain-containing protein [bacterium]|nr:DUF5671 domain-containing protein [bacterium]